MKWHFWLSCLYKMRTTFLLPLARMLEAFYRAIKAVNQSLLNDPWFLTCFTGSDTVVAAHCTHGFALCGLPTQSMAVCTMNTLCGNDVALLVPRCRLPVYISPMFVYVKAGGEKKTGRRVEEQKQEDPGAGVVFQLPMYSCRDVFATVSTSHKFGSTGYI